MRGEDVRAGDGLLGSRFEILRTVGRGANGIVYEARDKTTTLGVALKTLISAEPATIYQLKQEFRALSQIRHPNLVRLHELIINGHDCFFTMELIDGLDFLDFVRARGGPDYARLRSGLAQLCAGLDALHAAGKLHRDIKPSNVLVTREGRVVLLDFGLATDLRSRLSAGSRAGELAGTLAYMAPEQLWNGEVTPKSDCYSVGVMMYECLTGNLPAGPDNAKAIVRHADFRPSPPSTFVPGIPPDIDAAVCALLDPDPSARPSAKELPERLSPPAAGDAPISTHNASNRRTDRIFVGRFEELAKLQRAFSAVLRSETVLLRVRGDSGMGKTALVEHFLAQIESQRGAVTLRARCQPHETVPYNAIDGLVDQLSSYLKGLGNSECARLMPEHIEELIRVFPVLGRLRLPAPDSRGSSSTDEDPYLVRHRAEGALRQLLRNIAERVPLALWVDDVQWGDVASASLLRAVLQPPEPPRLLLIVSYRGEDRDNNALLQAVESENLSAPGMLDADVTVGPLDALDARELADLLLDGVAERSDSIVADIAREGNGSPFFIEQLVQSLVLKPDGEPAELRDLRVERVIRQRLVQLSASERRLLGLIAVSPGALDVPFALAAADLRPSDDPLLTKLSDECLIRLTIVRARRAVELYHDRIREVLLGQMDPQERTSCHAALARLMELQPDHSSGVLAHHLYGAGDLHRASACAERAGDEAWHSLAFMRAAEFYRLAGEWAGSDQSRITNFQVKRADALVMAGRCGEAASIYSSAAEGSPPDRALELRRLAVEQLLVSGRIDEGLRSLRPLLRQFGLRYPRALLVAMASTGFRLAGLAFRDLEPRIRSEQVDVRELAKADVCYSATRGMLHVDSPRAAYLGVLGVSRSLRTGDRFRIARSLAMVGALISPLEGWIGRCGSRFLDEAGRIASLCGDPYLCALATVGKAARAMLQGDSSSALELGDEAFELLRFECRGMGGWETKMARMITLRALEDLGRYEESVVRAANSRGNPGSSAIAMARSSRASTGDMLHSPTVKARARYPPPEKRSRRGLRRDSTSSTSMHFAWSSTPISTTPHRIVPGIACSTRGMRSSAPTCCTSPCSASMHTCFARERLWRSPPSSLAIARGSSRSASAMRDASLGSSSTARRRTRQLFARERSASSAIRTARCGSSNWRSAAIRTRGWPSTQRVRSFAAAG